MNKFTQLQFRFFIFITVFCSSICMGWAQNEEDDPYADCPMKQPYLDVGTEESDVVCNLPGSITFWIKGYDKSSNIGTDYYIYYGDQEYTGSVDINDGTTFLYKDHLTNDQLAANNGLITYTYNKSYCDLGEDFWEIKVMAIGCNPKYMRVGSTSLQLQKKGIVDFEEEVKCDYKACFTNKSEGFIDLVCDLVEYYKWDFGDGTIETQFTKSEIAKNVCHDYKCAGKYNVKLYAYSGLELENGKRVGSNCGSDSISKEITILPLPELKKIEDINVCKGQTVSALNLPNLDVCMYDWYNPTTKKCEKKDICALFKDSADKPKKVAQKFDIKVTGDNIGLSMRTHTFEANLPDEEKFIPSFIATNETDKPLKATICITPYNENDCKGEEVCYTITVHPSARMSNIQNLSFCHNTTTKVPEFKASIPDVTFTWKVKEGDWQKIGMPTNQGEGNIPSFTAINNTKDPIKVTIEVQADSEMCNGSTDEFTITVYPYPTFETKFQSPTTCGGKDGWIEFSGLDLNTTPYQVQYNKDNKGITSSTYSATNGTIKVTGLSKGSYTDIAIGAFNSGCLTHTDNITLVDPPAPNAPKISSNTPICIGTSLELKVDEADSDIQHWKWEGPLCNGTAWSSSLKEPSRGPMEYCMAGTYKLTVERNKCEAFSTTEVTYREDPEVTLNALASVCIGKPFTIDDEVTYNWKNIPTNQQKIKWEIINSENQVIGTQTVAKPTFTINTPGNYSVKVSLDGFGCNGDKLTAQQPLKVKDSNYTLALTADNTAICVNNTVTFTNNTAKDQEITYKWSVTPNSGFTYTNSTNNTSEAPSFLFNQIGNYTITVVSDNECTQRTQSFTVKVQNNPTVILNLPNACIGNAYTTSDESVKYTWNNVQGVTPTWSATPAEGIAFSNPNSEYPTITYSKEGTYTIRVDMPDAGCGQKNYAEKEIEVYNANYTPDITQDKETLCVGEKLNFTNNTVTLEQLNYAWSATPSNGVSISDASASAPSISFSNPGDYSVKVIIKGQCADKEMIFNVRVNKDPEVTIEKIEDICTNSPLELNESLVKYTWYNTTEAEQQATWTVVEGDASNVTFSHANSLYTQVTFAKDGKYKLQVEINQPECGGTKNIATAEVSVMDANFELKVENQDITICEGKQVAIVNNTDNNQGVSYTWTVTDAEGNETTGWEFAAGNQETSAPVFTFTHYGNYIVKVIAQNICKPRNYQFNVRVNKDPEVSIEKIEDICTNSPLELNESLVKYTWYNTTEAEKQATWTVVEGDASSVTFSHANSLYTQATFAKDGKYKLQVEINQPECGGTKNIATAEVSVMDANFELKVENQDITICEGEQVAIVNNTDNNQGVSYTWTVTDAEGNETTGWEFAAGNQEASAPVFTFTHYGNYIVKVIAQNICKPRNYQFNVRVNKDPEVTFHTFETICNNSTLTIDESKVTYQWYNMLDEEKELEWSIVPNTGVTEQSTTTTKPSYIFTEPGEYTLAVKIKATGCDKTHIEQSVNITVITDNLDLQVTQSAPEGCIPLDITFTNTTSDTDQIKYLWKVDKPQENWEFKQGSATEKSPVFTFKTEDLYKVTLEAQNKCNTKTLDFNIQTYDKVLFALAKLPTACGEYTFDATSETEGLQVTGNESNIKSVLWMVYKSTDNTNGNYQVAPAESYAFTAGDPTTLRPIIQLKEWGHYKIELQAQTICNDETVSTTIEIEEPIVITLTQPDPLCANIPDEYNQNPYTLIAAPSDGKWTWKEAVPSEQLEYLDADNQLFYPNQPGTYALTYTVQRKACTAQESLEIIVKDYPSLEIGEDIYICEKDQTPVLLEASPNNGVWTGNGVSVEDNKYYFNPPLTVGSYNLTYTITDAFGCKNRDYKQAHIKPLPKTDFSPEQHCLPDPIIFTPVVDVNTHQFYVNYGDGTEGSDLTHLYDNIGIYDVKLIVSAPNGCLDSLTKSVVVEKFPDQKIIMDKKTGCSPFTPTIELEFDYIDPNTTFTWDFGQYGRQFTEQPTDVTFTAEEEDVTYYFDITVKNICGEYTVRDSVRVLARAKAGVIPSVERGCSPVEVEFKNVSKGSIQRMQYTWDFGDGSEREHGFQASHTFTTTMDKDSTYTVMLIAENACGIDTTYQDIYVIPPVVFPQIIAKNQTGCVGEDICLLNKTMEVTPHHEIITYHWDYGNGAQSDNPTDTCTVFNAPGEYTIKLTITTSCGSSETDEAKVRIYDLPKFNISAVDYICRKDTVFPRIEILSDIREVEWDFGTGDKSNMMQPKYGYAVAGEYTITATATENNFAACEASKNIPLLVRELPNPIITPLEVDSCSPFTYRPIVHDEEINYTIDYENDGFRNANTTHTYVNTSLEPATYQTKFYLEDKYGCKSNNHGVVTIYPEPIATITIAEVTEARPEVVTFANNSYGANYCKWTLPYRGITETCHDVQEYYYDNILKTTYLEVANEYGCTDKDSIDHQPLMKGLYFPNTFAPNGVTEENRTFNGVGIGLKEYRLEIFDLFGNLIYYTTSLDDKGCPNQGWDGRDQHGNMMPQDVYTWKAEAVFIDGSVYTFGNDYNNIPGTEVNDVNLHRGSVLLLHR